MYEVCEAEQSMEYQEKYRKASRTKHEVPSSAEHAEQSLQNSYYLHISRLPEGGKGSGGRGRPVEIAVQHA